MTSWLSIQNYSPILVFFVGILTFTGYTGLGLTVQKAFRLSFPSPWRQVLGVLLGILTVSLFIQILGITALAYRTVLNLLWVLIVIVGTYEFIREIRYLVPPSYKKPDRLALLPMIAAALALGVNLLVAVAPCVRNDELHYHMLAPGRIVLDAALHFYRLPWEGAIYPHMIFQISLTPLHALGFPDAGNVLSWSLGLTLIWLCWYLITERLSPPRWVYLCSAPIVVSYWSVVYYVTGGSQAFGDLAFAAAMAAFLYRKDLIKQIALARYALFFSTVIVAFVSSKATLIPLGIFLFFLLIFFLFREKNDMREFYRACICALLPWIIFYLPIVIWTFWHSGSPFGPVFSNRFSRLIHHAKLLNINFKVSDHLLRGRYNFIDQIKKFAIYHSPIIWFAIPGLIFAKTTSLSNRLVASSIFLLQLSCITFLLPFETRYFSGLLPGFLISFGMLCPAYIKDSITKHKHLYVAVCFFFLMPWLMVQSFYASQFFPISLNLQSKYSFYRKYISFFDDYVKIDKLLPKNACILSRININPPFFRMSSPYVPRPIYFDYHDVPQWKNVYLMVAYESKNKRFPKLPQGIEVGSVVYKDETARYANQVRIPGRSSKSVTLEVLKLEDKR